MESRRTEPLAAPRRVALTLFTILLATTPLGAQVLRENRANWALAERYSAENLRPFVYSSSVTPGWINNSDEFWYRWQDRHGIRFWRVDPARRSRRSLFDHQKMADQLSQALRKPQEAHQLPIRTLTFTSDAKAIRFAVDNRRFEYDLERELLRETAPGEAPPPDPAAARGGGDRAPSDRPDYRNFAPDRKSYVYVENDNLYYVDLEKGEQPIPLTTDGERHYTFPTGFFGGGQQQQEQQREQQRRDRDQQDEDQRRQGEMGEQPPPAPRRSRPNVVWSPDSRAFAVLRTDSRKVADLFLVNPLAQPRPTLTTYRYAMPGEANVPQVELWWFARDRGRLERLPVERWKDQRIYDVHWANGSEKLRLVRRDRLQRNMELIEIEVRTGAIASLLTESVENAYLERRDIRYVRPGGDFIWWSERTGWGHFYLYSHDGKLKHAITSGPYRAEAIVAVDERRGVLWFRAYGREPNECPYYAHLYRVNLDGSDLTLLDPGDADHNTLLSPSRRFAVDNYSRVDLPPRAVVRNDRGQVVMELEEMDVSRLVELGWKPPERFVVKAADGITDLYGNMWKPFDFDPRRRYPIIAHVYPGPQTEQVATTFSPTASQQRLANLGFIVVQLGNRGGSPRRSNAYHSYGYFNLRDYGLADKKAGIEQLAVTHPWIDLDRVGIYGHSGGGFMTAAAMMLPPYNEFFKVGVASAGNHDNNIYNQNWSEQHHGLREVPASRGESGEGGQSRSGQEGGSASGGASGDVRYEIKVPTNAELATHLKGRLLLVHGDMDNNVHPANTMRLVEALIRANKRFDLLILPGKAHSFGDMQPYFTRVMHEYFAEHLLGDYYRTSAEIGAR